MDKQKRSGQVTEDGIAHRIDDALSTYRFRYLGLGFISAWVFCSWETTALFPGSTGASINSDLSWLYSATTVILAYFVIAFIGRRHEISEYRWLYIVAPIVTAASTLIAPLDTMLVDPESPLFTVLSVTSGVLTGSASACLVMLWCCLYKQLAPDFVEVIVPASSVIMIICLFIVPDLSGVPALVIVALLPLISGFMLALCREDVQVQESDHERIYTQAPPSSRWFIAVLITIAVVYAINSFLEVSTAPGEFAGVGMDYEFPNFMGNLFAVVFSIVVILYSVRVDIVSLFRFTTPILIVAIALFCGTAPWMRAASLALASVVESAFDIILLIVFVQIARASNLSASMTVGLTEGAAQAGVLIGNIASDMLMSSSALSSSSLTAVSLILICIFSVSVAFIPGRRRQTAPEEIPADMPQPLQTGMVSSGGSEAPGSAPASGQDRTSGSNATTMPGHPPDEAFDDICMRIAKRYGLSERENEVFGYLARGRSQPYIREALFLSKNTIASYTKHVYAKLGVHSRQELINLVESSKDI